MQEQEAVTWGMELEEEEVILQSRSHVVGPRTPHRQPDGSWDHGGRPVEQLLEPCRRHSWCQRHPRKERRREEERER